MLEDSAGELSLLLSKCPQLGEHTVAPPALRPFEGMGTAAHHLTALLRGGCNDARAHAALGNVLVREGRYLDAVEAYRAAVELDPTFAQAHIATADLSYILRDEESASAHIASALWLQRVFPDPLEIGSRTPVLLLLRDAPYAVNTPLEMLLDRSAFALHKVFVDTSEPLPELPPYAVAVTAFGFARDAAAERAAAFLRASGSPAVNDPERIAGTARERLPETLAGIASLVAVPSQRVPRDELVAGDAVTLVRPADSQAGEGLALVDSAAVLAAHLERFPSGSYHVSPFIDYRSADGWYRKYRVIFVDGVAFPYHLAIAPRWMVHYQSAPMREHAWMRDEELTFLADPRRAIAGWDAFMPAIARAVGLDYFGIDAAVLPDGRLLVFEADSGMLVHDEDPSDVFAAKRPYVARIREALTAALRRRAGKDAPSGGSKSPA